MAILALTPTADHTGKEGYFVNASSGDAALVSAATDIPIGVITEGAPTTGKDSVALPTFSGTVKVKVTATSPGTIALGTYGTIKSDGTVQADAGTGSRVRVCRFAEAAAAGELAEAYLIEPLALS